MSIFTHKFFLLLGQTYSGC